MWSPSATTHSEVTPARRAARTEEFPCTPIPRRLWQIAGVLGIVHIVLIPVGIAIQQSPLFEEGTNGIRESYVEGDLSRTLTGWLVGSFDFLLLIPVLVFLARALGRRTEAGGWAAQTGLMCGIAYVTVIFAVGFPAGAAAMYGAQHGLEVDAAFALNNLRIFGYFLSLMLLAGSTLGIALSAHRRRCAPTLVRRLRHPHRPRPASSRRR